MASPLSTAIDSAIENLIQTYHDLNNPLIDELSSEPSPLEFMRHVAKNRPLVVRKGASLWPAVQLWNVNYLTEIMKDAYVNIANTPHGNADAIATDPKDGRMYFVKPFERDEKFDGFLDYLQKQQLSGNLSSSVKYAQTQNDNFRGEYSDLFKDVEQDITWARIALDQKSGPDAINLWIGNSRSVTALHRDNYENIYVQVIGQKHFVLVPPMETACVMEKSLPSATYAPRKHKILGEENGPVADDLPLQKLEELEIVPDEDTDPVPCAMWDPDQPNNQNTGLSSLSRPMRVTLKPGDMLYLPSLWCVENEPPFSSMSINARA
ncbi:hypothetical protein MMC30_006911 [Trapelia coarctata]|nr:hypothetical protein [Trapelia coarctata]